MTLDTYERPGRDMTSLELVKAFEREAGERWFRETSGEPTIYVSPPYPGIVPTWPRLIRERAIRETAQDGVETLEVNHDWLPYVVGLSGWIAAIIVALLP